MLSPASGDKTPIRFGLKMASMGCSSKLLMDVSGLPFIDPIKRPTNDDIDGAYIVGGLSGIGLRNGVRQLCAHFPDQYWRDLDKRETYPTEFVNAMAEDGYLAALIPEE